MTSPDKNVEQGELADTVGENKHGFHQFGNDFGTTESVQTCM